MLEEKKNRSSIFGKQKEKEKKKAADAFAEELKNEFGVTVSQIADTTEDLIRRGYHKLSEKAKGELLPLLQYIPGFAANQAVVNGAKIAFTEATQGTYRPLLQNSMQLLKSTSGNGNVRGLAMNKATNIRDIPEWVANNAEFRVSSAPQIALGVFSALSLVTGQYFQAEINKKLKVIDSGVQEILQMLVDLEINDLQVCGRELEDITNRSQYLVHSYPTLIAALNQLHSIQHKSQAVIDLMRRNITMERKGLGEKEKQEEISRRLQKIGVYMHNYHYALHVYNVATLLELKICGTMNPDEMELFHQQIVRRTEDYKEFYQETNDTLMDFLENTSSLNKRQTKDYLVAGGFAAFVAVFGGIAGRILSFEAWKTLDGLLADQKKKLKDTQLQIVQGYFQELRDTDSVDAPAKAISDYIDATRRGMEIIVVKGEYYTNVPVSQTTPIPPQGEVCATATVDN